jgi:hypothetical protein
VDGQQSEPGAFLGNRNQGSVIEFVLQLAQRQDDLGKRLPQVLRHQIFKPSSKQLRGPVPAKLRSSVIEGCPHVPDTGSWREGSSMLLPAAN